MYLKTLHCSEKHDNLIQKNMILLTLLCESCGKKMKSRTGKGKMNVYPVKAVAPKTILNQYRQLLQNHPEIINGLLLH
ncbi:MAG: hypothetical protein JWP12_2268 [Bacteroidetes bacterium]|nr:hypothetical protein [Bacteroidota bacterium]